MFRQCQAAEAIREDMPRLKTETPDDLMQCFERHCNERWHHGRLGEWYGERRVV
jgi:hypothetical protein